jgi:hypothetical protein
VAILGFIKYLEKALKVAREVYVKRDAKRDRSWHPTEMEFGLLLSMVVLPAHEAAIP